MELVPHGARAYGVRLNERLRGARGLPGFFRERRGCQDPLPAITNALCRRLDRRLAGLAKKRGFSYTRYADDVTFSGDEATAVPALLANVRRILKEEGFTVHPTKTRIMRRGRRQEVTGVIVNQRPTMRRSELRELRAILHNAAKHGLESQNRDKRPHFAAYLRGRVEFACMVDPQRAPVLRAALTKALLGEPGA